MNTLRLIAFAVSLVLAPAFASPSSAQGFADHSVQVTMKFRTKACNATRCVTGDELGIIRIRFYVSRDGRTVHDYSDVAKGVAHAVGKRHANGGTFTIRGDTVTYRGRTVRNVNSTQTYTRLGSGKCRFGWTLRDVTGKVRHSVVPLAPASCRIFKGNRFGK